MRNLISLCVIVSALTCGACATTGFNTSLPPLPAPFPGANSAPATATPSITLASIPLADAQQALADAQTAKPPDTVAIPCYQWIIDKLQSLPAAPTVPTGAGLLVLHEQARLLKLQAGNLTGFNQGASLACGPLVFDDEATAAALGAALSIK